MTYHSYIHDSLKLMLKRHFNIWGPVHKKIITNIVTYFEHLFNVYSFVKWSPSVKINFLPLSSCLSLLDLSHNVNKHFIFISS